MGFLSVAKDEKAESVYEMYYDFTESINYKVIDKAGNESTHRYADVKQHAAFGGNNQIDTFYFR